MAQWYVITGAPGSGKTLLIDMLAALGYATVPEAARNIIDEGLARGLTLQDIRGDEHAWQEAILKRVLEYEAAAKQDTITFLDRGAHDGLAHLRYYGLTPKDHWQPMTSHKPYRTVFLLEPLPDVERDYARIEDANFAKKITAITDDVYSELGMEPIRIPFLPPEERLKIILSHLDTPKALQ